MLVYRMGHPQVVDDMGVPLGPYRFENASKTPYKRVVCDDGEEFKQYLVEALNDAHSDDAEHPTPCLDGIDSDHMDYWYCGTTSRKKLRQWFIGFRTWLRRTGYLMYVYWVPDEHVIHGTYQIVADVSKGFLVEAKPL
jgi:hypothetical protein